MEPKRDRLLRPDQAAAILACSKRFVYVLIAERKLTALTIGSSHGLRVTESSVNAFIQRRIKEYGEVAEVFFCE